MIIHSVPGVPKNVSLSHKKLLESCLSCCAVSKYEALFWTSGTFHGTLERYFEKPDNYIIIEVKENNVLHIPS